MVQTPIFQMGETSVFMYHIHMTIYNKGHHTVYHHRHHIVWITKYRYKVMRGKLGYRVRMLISQVAEEMGVRIINGVISSDHVHIFVSIPPHVAVSDFVKIAKGRSSRKVQQEFLELRRKYWGRHFWGRGFYSTTSGNITDEIINEYINNHIDANRPENEGNISLE